MGSGLSMASVNKIKELANSKEYSLAVDILENQDLTKSLNPQFLRLCGEIYLKTNMYKEARAALVRAHKLAPEAKRVMFLFVDLYYRMGYKNLAEKYYNMYLFENDKKTPETKQLEYIYKKANNAKYEELQEIIEPMYSHTMDYDWSFELYLLYKMQGKDDKAKALVEVYVATYKNTNNILVLDDINNNYVDVDMLYEVYSKDNVLDDDPEQEDIRQEEATLLKDDDLRMNPKEAEITIVFDDRTENNVSKRKLKKLLKQQDKELEVDADEGQSNEEQDEDDSDDDVASDKKGLFKKVISKIKKNNKDNNQNTDEILSEDNVQEDNTQEDNANVDKDEINNDETTNHIVKDELVEDAIEDIDSDIETCDELLEDGDLNMRKKHSKYNKEKYESVISVEEDDDFTAESETIDDLSDDNSFSSSTDFDDFIDISKNKMKVVFEEAELVSDDSTEEFEVDDFSVNVEDEFGVMDSEYKELYEETVEEIHEEYVEEATEEVEETAEESYEEYVEETTEELEETVEESYDKISGITSFAEENKKKELDFPVFRSSLFPEYKQDISVVENNFNEIMSEAQDKFNENKLKEEQMLKEAEALLASMGISLDNINVTNTNPESISNVINNEPSRDELKASLEIDSVKKDILEKLKEYR